jgi:hypothetical protein
MKSSIADQSGIIPLVRKRGDAPVLQCMRLHMVSGGEMPTRAWTVVTVHMQGVPE